MPEGQLSTRLREMTAEVTAEALARRRRPDPVLPGSGGPGGNARLTAWTGLVLLVLFFVEGITLLDVRGLLSWHVAVGVLLVPPALLKTASTGWRIVRYYSGNRAYRRGGPPPMPLRLLGPLVVISTLAVLGTGLALIALGPQASRNPLISAAGFGLSALTLHKATFLVWFVVTAAHTLTRLLPALRLTMPRSRGIPAVPGRQWRAGLLLATLGIAVVATAVVLGVSGPWQTAVAHQRFDDGRVHAGR